MTIVNVGLSHRIAPAEVLEKLAVPSAELGGVLARLLREAGVGRLDLDVGAILRGNGDLRHCLAFLMVGRFLAGARSVIGQGPAGDGTWLD